MCMLPQHYQLCCLWEVQATLLLFPPVTVQGYREEVNPHGWLLDLFLSLAMDWMDQQALQLSCCCCCPCHLVEWEVGYPEPQEVSKPASHFATCQHKRNMHKPAGTGLQLLPVSFCETRA